MLTRQRNHLGKSVRTLYLNLLFMHFFVWGGGGGGGGKEREGRAYCFIFTWMIHYRKITLYLQDFLLFLVMLAKLGEVFKLVVRRRLHNVD